MATSNCTTKSCTRCLKTLPATTEYFSPSPLGKYGIDSRCKQCRAQLALEKRRKQGIKPKPQRSKGDLRQCSRCERWLPATDEYFQKRHDRDVFHSQCRDCRNNRAREYQRLKRQNPVTAEQLRQYNRKRYPLIRERIREYERRPEVRAKRRLYNKEYEQRPERKLSRRLRQADTRRKRANAPGSYTSDDVQLQLRTQKGLCWWCSKPHGENYEIDHRIPLSRGGTNWPENICITCFDCNRSKHNKLPHEWTNRLL